MDNYLLPVGTPVSITDAYYPRGTKECVITKPTLVEKYRQGYLWNKKYCVRHKNTPDDEIESGRFFRLQPTYEFDYLGGFVITYPSEEQRLTKFTYFQTTVSVLSANYNDMRQIIIVNTQIDTCYHRQESPEIFNLAPNDRICVWVKYWRYLYS